MKRAAPDLGGLYAPEDVLRAERRAGTCGLVLGGVEALLLAAYGIGIALGQRGMMLTALLLAFGFATFWGDLCLLPALRYRKFLRELGAGLRRGVICDVERLEDAPQTQDGARVHALHVRLAESGDGRIYYINADHAAQVPGPGTRIRLESCGRHVTGLGLCAGEEQP